MLFEPYLIIPHPALSERMIGPESSGFAGFGPFVFSRIVHKICVSLLLTPCGSQVPQRQRFFGAWTRCVLS